MDRPFQDKLQQFTATPPDGVWNKISDALDADENFSQRLYQYEEQPPLAAWDLIEKNLEEDTPAKVIPFFTRFRTPIRYIAAACFIAVILVTVTLTVKRTEAGALEAGSPTTVPTTHSTARSTTSDQPGGTVQVSPSKGGNKSAAGKTVTIRADSSGTANHPGKNTVITIADNRHTVNNKNVKPVYSSLNGYVTFRDGDGRMRKVTKKLADFVNCKEDDNLCKQRLLQLRQKMAAKTMSTDFTGLLEMLRQLQ